MQFAGSIHIFSREVKFFLAAFVVVLNIGYFTGLGFGAQTESTHPQGIEDNYLGNEEVEDAVVMKFKKGPREMLTIIHTHVLSLSFIFFLLGGILLTTSLSQRLKLFLLIEPFVSIIVTFGGIYLMWEGMLWMKYVVVLSGILMTVCFLWASSIILFQLLKKKA